MVVFALIGGILTAARLTWTLLRLAVLLAPIWIPAALIAHYTGIGADAAPATTIVRAVDGDTLIARLDGQEQRVRVLGIDTPETVKPHTDVQTCGPEASARAKNWVRAHRTVRLQRDPAAPNTDRYGRLLRYVTPTDRSRDLSTVQVAAGLARIAAYGQDLQKLPDLQKAETRAKTAHRGLWGTSCTQR